MLPPLDARIPVWDTADLLPRACPLCGAAEAAPRFVRPDGLTVRRCACTTYYVSPAPSAAQLDAFYAHYDADHRRDARIAPANLARSYRRSDPRADLRLRVLSAVHPLAGARVLDVGFGRARLLHDVMRLGATPCGVELDPGAIECAHALGIERVWLGTVASLPETERFDVILLSDLVEHPLAPLDLLAAATRHLEPGGHLLLWTPNGDSGRRDPAPIQFRVDLEHMQYFTPAGCGRLADRFGLALVHLETVGFPDLVDIGRLRERGRSPGVRLKTALRHLPGFARLNAVRRALLPGRTRDDRDGDYHLFALLQKPGPARLTPPGLTA